MGYPTYYSNSEQVWYGPSDYGNALRDAMPGLLTKPQILSRQTYLFRGFTGMGQRAPVSQINPLVHERMYGGDSPLSQQPLVYKPWPWER